MPDRSRRSRWTTSIIVLMLLSGTLGMAHAGAALPPVLFGAKVSPASGSAFTGLESKVGRTLTLTRLFYVWDSPFPDAMATWVKGRSDITPVISVKTKLRSGDPVSWSSIANAQPGQAVYDRIVTWANRMKGFGRTVYFSFNHEASNWKSVANGTSDEYIAAWRRVRKIFNEIGATNVRWTWILGPTAYKVPSTDRRSAPKWYPGDAHVDVIAIDAYNWARCHNRPWSSFANETSEFVAFAALHPTEATMVAEWGSVEDPEQPRRKAQWILDGAAEMKTWPRLIGASYFDATGDGCHWELSTSTSAMEAFRQVASDPYFGGSA